MKVKSLKRTGNVYTYYSSEFEITYEDGTTQKIWSPPWHDLTEEEEEKNAMEFARTLAKERRPISKFKQMSIDELKGINDES